MESICKICGDSVESHALVHLESLPKNIDGVICGDCHSTLLKFHEAEPAMNQLNLETKNNPNIESAEETVSDLGKVGSRSNENEIEKTVA